ncbi:MAG: FAD-dependent oxidoreductase [Ginsengibacter sp.]
MSKTLLFTFLIFLLVSCKSKNENNVTEVDICVYGGTSAGIIAAYTARKQGKSVIVIEPGNYLGGLTSGGLGATDIGNKYAITGLAKDFYRRIGKYYDKFEQWTFEPHVASQVYDDLISEAGLTIHKNRRLVSVKKEDGWIKEIVVEDSKTPSSESNQTVKAKIFIDCTYEGDLMAKAGVSYITGREGNDQYGETYDGVQLSDFHQLPDGIDPYVKPGDPSSGMLWGIDTDSLARHVSGDKKIQAYNFRLCLTQDKGNQISFVEPDNYDATHYELLARIIDKEKWPSIRSNFTVDTLQNGIIKVHNTGGFLIKDMPNGKTDFNNFGGFSTDMIGANYDYPEGNYDTRKKIWKDHEDYTKGLLYFLSHDEKIPQAIREEMLSWGWCKDEFKDLDGFSSQLYVREARRMIGELVMTQKHCVGDEVVDDQVGMAAYGMDSHNCQRLVVNGMVKNEGDVQKRVPKPYPISYRAIVPKENECKNLLVPVCVSASHIAFGSIRMEPVFMVLGQSAATAAVFAINNNTSVQQVDTKKLLEELTKNPLADGSQPEILIDNNDTDNVLIKGMWQTKAGGYGINQLYDDQPGELKTIGYSPTIPKSGEYEIYAYFSKLKGRSTGTWFAVNVNSEEKPLMLQTSSIKEMGLSSGEWVKIGVFNLPKGKNSYVEITNKGADGIVTADAIIWEPVKRKK